MSKFTLQRVIQSDLEKTPTEFWTDVYKNLSPIPKCDTCNKNITNPLDWISFNCECQKYYHKNCVADEWKCKTCDVKDFFTFSNFPKKFLTPNQYREIYDRSILNLDPSTQLKIYQLWFIDMQVMTPPLLDLYTYLEPHNPSETMKLLKDYAKTHYLMSFDPAIYVKYNEDRSETVIGCKFKEIDYANKKIFVDIESFWQRFREYSYDLIGRDFPFNTNINLVGGAVHKCLESRIKMDDIPVYSDINICIANPSTKVVSREMQKVIKYFNNRFGEDIYWFVNKNRVYLYIPGYNRRIKITLFKNTLDNLLDKYDFSHIQYAYTGQKILTTLAGLKYASSLISIHSGYYDVYFPKRLCKLRDLKLSVALPMDKVGWLNIPKIEKIDYWYPTYNDDLAMVKQQLKTTKRISDKYVTKGKPFRIFYAKIPKSFNNDRLISRDMIGNFGEVEIIGFSENGINS